MSDIFYSMFIIYAERYPLATVFCFGFILALLVKFWAVMKKNILLAIPYAIFVLSMVISAFDVLVFHPRGLVPMEYSFLLVAGFIAGFAVFNLKTVFQFLNKIF